MGRGARVEVARLAFCGKGKGGGARCVVVAREAERGRTRGREGEEYTLWAVGCWLWAWRLPRRRSGRACRPQPSPPTPWRRLRSPVGSTQ